MKITKKQLRTLIEEEITLLREYSSGEQSRPPGGTVPERQKGPYPAGTLFRISFAYSDYTISVEVIHGHPSDDPGVYVRDFDTITNLINWIETQSEESVYILTDWSRDREMNPADAIRRLGYMKRAFEKLSK